MVSAVPDLEIFTQREDRVTVVRCVGRIDAATHQIFSEALRQLFDGGQFNLILDLSEIKFMSSPGARAIIGALAKTEDNDGKIVFINPNPNIRAVFSLIGLTDLIAVAQNLTEAISLF
jgi:anti-anti-sigma factor